MVTMRAAEDGWIDMARTPLSEHGNDEQTLAEQKDAKVTKGKMREKAATRANTS
jgi:hypothetical protein